MRILINVDVDDLERAIAFYANACGLRVGRRLFGGSVAELLGAPSPLYLLSKGAGTAPSPGASSLRDYRRHWTPVHLDFEVDDMTAAVERALAAGARIEGDIQSFGWGQLAMLGDPFGHGFCFIHFYHGDYDA